MNILNQQKEEAIEWLEEHDLINHINDFPEYLRERFDSEATSYVAIVCETFSEFTTESFELMTAAQLMQIAEGRRNVDDESTIYNTKLMVKDIISNLYEDIDDYNDN